MEILLSLFRCWTWPPTYAEPRRVPAIGCTWKPSLRSSWTGLIQIIDPNRVLAIGILTLGSGTTRSSSSSYSAWILDVATVQGTTMQYARWYLVYQSLGLVQLPFGALGLIK